MGIFGILIVFDYRITEGRFCVVFDFFLLQNHLCILNQLIIWIIICDSLHKSSDSLSKRSQRILMLGVKMLDLID